MIFNALLCDDWFQPVAVQGAINELQTRRRIHFDANPCLWHFFTPTWLRVKNAIEFIHHGLAIGDAFNRHSDATALGLE
jgi:hypothetical protein